jgi:hypothetical protein
MTLQCQCGSFELKITDQQYGDGYEYEDYECQLCGRSGRLVFDAGPGEESRLTGCLEQNMEYL